MNGNLPRSTDGTDEVDGTGRLRTDDRHRVLASECRRRVLAVLAARPLPMDLEELASAVVTERTGTSPPPPGAVDDVSVSLHHNHLPMLSSLGMLGYDPDTKRISEAD